LQIRASFFKGSLHITMKHALTILVLTILMTVAHPTATQAQRWLSYEPQTVELDGRLVLQSRYGPPNYGEQPKTDQKVKVPVLVLKNPVHVLANQEDGYNSQPVYWATQIQLAFVDNGTAYNNLIGKPVVVTGSLFHAHTGHHFTDVVLKVRSIERRTAAYARRRFDVCSIMTYELNRRQSFATSKSLLNEFLAIVGDEKTERSFKHSATGLIINAAVEYMDLNTGRTRIPSIRIALSVSDTEQDAFDSADKAEAGTNYKRDWGGLYTTKRVIVGDSEHTFILHCSDGSTRRNK
jgi:Domain of unknown function (DUF4431)